MGLDGARVLADRSLVCGDGTVDRLGDRTAARTALGALGPVTVTVRYLPPDGRCECQTQKERSHGAILWHVR